MLARLKRNRLLLGMVLAALLGFAWRYNRTHVARLDLFESEWHLYLVKQASAVAFTGPSLATVATWEALAGSERNNWKSGTEAREKVANVESLSLVYSLSRLAQEHDALGDCALASVTRQEAMRFCVDVTQLDHEKCERTMRRFSTWGAPVPAPAMAPCAWRDATAEWIQDPAREHDH